ncbi:MULTISPECIES: diguanylate cyclase [unclassified Idiomarina]|uniref:sensor domain-containing diguanylate cyclase n=1 Tax=unclassified Idiomarina TaxID=2614829 RepID=UPI001D2ED24A|nr:MULTISPECIES: diguanylate cyclase [unclassified Idiomarina]MCJ8315893.1 diguanylate cyclase [Idiomarina sp.]NQZ15808.1 sensor domain-containing diguanylate cyclase [Idiomarina sp.]
MRQHLLRTILLILAWVLLWRVAAVMEYGPHASIWFPPAGLTFAAFLVMSWRAFPAILLGGVITTLWVSDLYGDQTPVKELLVTGVTFGVAHTVPYFLGAWLLRSKLIRLGSHGLSSTIMTFLGIAALSSFCAAWLGTEVMISGSLLEPEALWYTWLPWWIGDLSGVIVLTPIFIALVSWRYPQIERWLGGLKFTEGGGSWSSFASKLLITLVMLAVCLIISKFSSYEEAAFVVFFLILPLLWISYTESPLKTAIALAVFSTITAFSIGLLGLMDYAIVYQFAVTVIASSAWFGLTVPALIAHNQYLTHQVSQDGLTSAASREHFMQQADLLLKMAKRRNKPISVIMFDVDKFKSINDIYGHIIGDSALVEITQAVNTQLRESDILGRFGGDEFMILLPDTDQSGAVGVAHKLREAISRITISSLSERLSCSFGVAQVSKNEHIMVTIDRADRALLQAKRNGRDRIEKDAV